MIIIFQVEHTPGETINREKKKKKGRSNDAYTRSYEILPRSRSLESVSIIMPSYMNVKFKKSGEYTSIDMYRKVVSTEDNTNCYKNLSLPRRNSLPSGLNISMVSVIFLRSQATCLYSIRACGAQMLILIDL